MKTLALALLALATLALPAHAAKSEVKGAALLEHPAVKVAMENMSLMHAGKIAEAVKLGTKQMQADWKAMPADDRKMMSEMMQTFSVADADFRADIQKYGVLSVDGDHATLTITKAMKDANGSNTETKTVHLQMEDGSWRVTRGQ